MEENFASCAHNLSKIKRMKLRVELLKSVVLEFRAISLRFQPDLSHATKDYADRIPPSRSRASVRRAEVLPGSLHGCSEHSRCWDNFARANGCREVDSGEYGPKLPASSNPP